MLSMFFDCPTQKKSEVKCDSRDVTSLDNLLINKFA
jgi:hypothetical protein